MRRLIGISLVSVMALSACGESLEGVDEERMLEATQAHAMDNARVQDGGYTEEDIEIVRACPAIQGGKEEFGHQGDYLIYWQTTDAEHQLGHRMNTSDYEVGGSVRMYAPTSEEDCVDY